MRLAAIFAAPALGQWSDYAIFNQAPSYSGAKFGSTYTSVESSKQTGNGKFCHSTQDKLIYRWDRSKYGYFQDYERVKCVGEEFYCFIEERAHFGQVIGIKAGCAQMASHPQVKRPTAYQVVQAGQWNNREPGRGRSFTNSGDSDPVDVFYGVGGCMAMPAQNQPSHLDSTVNTFNENNYHPQHNSHQAQCLRLHVKSGQKNLLPFGVSVCRACCIAGTDEETNYGTDGGDDEAPCNFLPFANGSSAPAIPPASGSGGFDCTNDAARATDSAADGSDATWCAKELVPKLEMVTYSSTAPVNLFSNSCAASPCTPVANTLSQI
ncbi:unnamed protein product [Oikopleura dioica]|uniref:Oikosin 12 n=1 Tax=Oikopleura dioica TaxID=34765 RepID=E4XSJ1_OIKDI|nr:unnamed protein product [Oikopleura dioica]CBY12705.1 unnamed protein product [Oikopleura dioica]CCG00920.1 oikosin 12 [Oikopleura dioica]